jgi:type III secretory pathway component EscU
VVFIATTNPWKLGFLVSRWGIEANPDKIRTIDAMKPLACIKDVQKLMGSLAALSHVISRLAERALTTGKTIFVECQIFC